MEELIPKLIQLDALIEDFDCEHQENTTFTYWRKYMKLVSILLRLTRAIRNSNWDLYINSFAEMLPWFAAFDYVNYRRVGSEYLADMKELAIQAPEVLRGFETGNFTVRETSQKFNQLPDDRG